MKLKNNNHLMYCLNIHYGEHWEENLAAIQHYAIKVKERFCPNAQFALGLRLSALAAHELLPKLDEFNIFLRKHDLYVVTINGFPYGPFHGTIIKENVYLPDWASTLRVNYTLDLAKILAGLLPEGEIGSISTVPCHYGKKEKPLIMDNLQTIATTLSEIEKGTGKHIILALEPEPDCYLHNLNTILDFFEKLYNANESAKRYIGVCLDTCHVAVEFESPLLWFEKLTQADIPVPKIQISAALLATVSKDSSQQDLQKMFKPFNDEQYLHQTRIYSEGELLKFKDLSEALTKDYVGEWRVHFHVPLTWFGEAISSTVNLIEDIFFKRVYLSGRKHFEVETYSYGILPAPKNPIIDSIVSELNWAKKKLKH